MRENHEDEITKEEVFRLIEDMHKIHIEIGEEIIHVIPQNFIVAGFSVLQFWQIIFAAGAKLAPQFPQNFVVVGFLAPQF